MNPRRVRHENAHCSIYLQKQNTGTNINTHGQKKKKKMASSIFIEPLGRARRYAIPQDECGSPRDVSTEAMLFCFCLSIFNHQCPLLSGSPVFTSWKTGNHPTPSCLDVIHVLPTDVFAWDLKAEGRKKDPSFLSSTNSGHESFVGREVFCKTQQSSCPPSAGLLWGRRDHSQHFLTFLWPLLWAVLPFRGSESQQWIWKLRRPPHAPRYPPLTFTPPALVLQAPNALC